MAVDLGAGPAATAAAAEPETVRPRAVATGRRPEILRPAWAEVDLDALVANLGHLRRRLGDTRVLAVIKADAYGHGAPRVSRALERAGVDWLGTALVEEGAEVRRAGVETPILVLGVAQPDQLPFYRRYRLTPTVSGLDQLALWSRYQDGASHVETVHLQVDTGMNRLGIAPDELGRALEVLRRHPRLELGGLSSHFADADLPESGRTADQERRFLGLLEALEPEERRRVILHLANSAGALHHPGSHHSMVRLGLALYGHDPAGDARVEAGLEPVLSVKTRIVLVRTLEPGQRVGYGGRWTARRPSRVAIVPVGYADGYGWRLSTEGHALVGGRRAPMAGAVSMDMSFFDVTDVPEEASSVGAEVVLLGAQGKPGREAGREADRDGQEAPPRITVHDLAAWADTLPYELLCLLGLRLARRHLEAGRAEVTSRFEGGTP